MQEDIKLYTGVVKFYNHKNKFGFVRIDDTGDEVYVAEKDLLTPIKDKDKVELYVVPGRKTLKGIKVKLLEQS